MAKMRKDLTEDGEILVNENNLVMVVERVSKKKRESN